MYASTINLVKIELIRVLSTGGVGGGKVLPQTPHLPPKSLK